jgi:hypothetical protein
VEHLPFLCCLSTHSLFVLVLLNLISLSCCKVLMRLSFETSFVAGFTDGRRCRIEESAVSAGPAFCLVFLNIVYNLPCLYHHFMSLHLLFLHTRLVIIEVSNSYLSLPLNIRMSLCLILILQDHHFDDLCSFLYVQALCTLKLFSVHDEILAGLIVLLTQQD